MVSDSRWSYSWDAENRLKSMSSLLGDGVLIQFSYDYLGRRVRKKVSGVLTSDTKYLYDGWNLVAEMQNGTITRSFLWGQDVSGALTTGAGVGALLMEVVHESSEYKGFLPAHDVNGNVVGMLRQSDGYVSAIYEYGPYGEFVRTQVKDSALDSQPVRFSSRYTDKETGLVYYGYRYYSPSLGRFLSRDPQGESGGINLYAFCKNDPINRWDMLGLETEPDEYNRSLFGDNWMASLIDEESRQDDDDAESIRDMASGKNATVEGVAPTEEEIKEVSVTDKERDDKPKQFSGVDDTTKDKKTKKSDTSPMVASADPNSGARNIFKNVTFEKTGILWWKTSDANMARARDQFTQIANSKNRDGTPTKAALNILEINNGNKPVVVQVSESPSYTKYSASWDWKTGVTTVLYNPSFSGSFDGVSYSSGLFILAHELAGHGFDYETRSSLGVGGFIADNPVARMRANEALEFEAVRVENSMRSSMGELLRQRYNFPWWPAAHVPQFDKYAK